MREVVLVPTFQREELLYVSLERLRNANASIPIRVFSDRQAYSVELEETCKRFGAGLFFRPKHTTHGNTLNVMESYRWAYEREFDRVYLVEDDVMVTPDFFEWHESVHGANPDLFCSCAWMSDPWTPERTWFVSVGVCFMRDKLAKVVEHARHAYYSDLSGYVLKHFPSSKLICNVGTFEQDGLILRVMERENGVSAWPQIPKCRHLGWWGYNRPTGQQPTGTFAQRIFRVREIMNDCTKAEVHFGRRIVRNEMGLTP